MSVTLAIGLAVGAMMLSFLIARAMVRYAGVLGFADIPNDRSLHTRATPRAGGVGFALVVPVATAIGLHALPGGITSPEGVLLISSAGLGLVGLIDDRYGLTVGVRLGAQCVAAAAIVAAGGVIRDVGVPGVSDVALAAFAVPVTVVWLVAFTNIYNFMDGIDGLAAVQAIVAAAAIGVVAEHSGSVGLAFAMVILASGAAGFLALNWSPARIFMGDVGSTFVGFTLAGWAAMPSQGVPAVVWLAALSPFLFDSSVTLVRRLFRGERVYEAHRSHYYQRLVQQGWSHAQTTLLYGALAAFSSTIAAFSIRHGVGRLIWIALVPPMLIPLIVRLCVVTRSTGSESS